MAADLDGHHDREPSAPPVGQDAMGEPGDPPGGLGHIHPGPVPFFGGGCGAVAGPVGPGHLRIAVAVQAGPADHPLDVDVDEARSW